MNKTGRPLKIICFCTFNLRREGKLLLKRFETPLSIEVNGKIQDILT